MSARRISIRVSQELEKQLAAIVQSTGQTESEVVRAALEDYCEKHSTKPSAYDLFKAAGLIGCAKDLPADLSTNPKYMEGFGRD
jgi:metal-responsive CopG/Arc/MetJ family transcriptional regulator